MRLGGSSAAPNRRSQQRAAFGKQMSLEELEKFVARLNHAVWFRLDIQMQQRAAALALAHHGLCDPDDVAGEGCRGSVSDPWLVRQGSGGNAAVELSRQ